MTIANLRKECLQIKGIEKVRVSRDKEGVFLYYREIIENGKFYKWTDFIHLDSWKDSLVRTRMEYERFYL